MNPIIRVRSLRHIYSKGTPFEKTAIDNIDLDIPKGQFLGIIGRTGSGKSTFIQHLNGLLIPDQGSILYDGEDIGRSKEARLQVRFKVGLVFQYPEHQLFEETVYKDIAFGPKNMRLGKDEIEERVFESAGFVGLPPDIMQKSPLELSGGQKRRVAIAGVIAMRPEVLILDEPTAGLDPSGRESILKNIIDYRMGMGSTVILVTHSMEEIARLTDRIVVFNQGSIAMDAAPGEVFSQSAVLREIGLAVPEVASIAIRLRELGVPLHGSVYTMEQLKRAILNVRGGASRA